jgi:hypothetical protein
VEKIGANKAGSGLGFGNVAAARPRISNSAQDIIRTAIAPTRQQLGAAWGDRRDFATFLELFPQNGIWRNTQGAEAPAKEDRSSWNSSYRKLATNKTPKGNYAKTSETNWQSGGLKRDVAPRRSPAVEKYEHDKSHDETPATARVIDEQEHHQRHQEARLKDEPTFSSIGGRKHASGGIVQTERVCGTTRISAGVPKTSPGITGGRNHRWSTAWW